MWCLCSCLCRLFVEINGKGLSNLIYIHKSFILYNLSRVSPSFSYVSIFQFFFLINLYFLFIILVSPIFDLSGTENPTCFQYYSAELRDFRPLIPLYYSAVLRVFRPLIPVLHRPFSLPAIIHTPQNPHPKPNSLYKFCIFTCHILSHHHACDAPPSMPPQ